MYAAHYSTEKKSFLRHLAEYVMLRNTPLRRRVFQASSGVFYTRENSAREEGFPGV